MQNRGLTFLITSIGLLGCVGLGVVANLQPMYLVVITVAIAVPIFCINSFERTVLGLLILRSALDAFSAQQIPAAFGIALNVFTIVCVTGLLLSKKQVKTDRFWWFLAGWVVLQSLWVILLPLGGLGLGGAYTMGAFREWLRVFSGVMVYLLVMQLKDRIHPEKIASALFLSLVAPLIAATLQVIFPPSMLPAFLVFQSGYAIEAGSRMNGTLGHPNVFATFTLLFLMLTLWKLGEATYQLPWLILAGALAFFLVSTKSLTGLMMLAAFVPAFLARKMNWVNLVGGSLLLGLVGFLFFSSPLGQERLQSLYGTPLLNPNIDVSRAILLQWSDGNSFNWRIAQWFFLLNAWQRSPWLGYGLDTSKFLTVQESYPHNDYMRFLAEGGIVGLVLFAIFWIALFGRLIQIGRAAPKGSSQRSLAFSIVAFLFSVLVGMLAGNVWNHTTLFFYLWTLVAVLGWDWEPEHKLESRQPSSRQFSYR